MRKTYSVNVQDDKLVSIEIDGVTYQSVDDIPDEDDCAQVESLIEDARDIEFDREREKFMREPDPSKMPLILFLLFLSIAILLLVISASSAVNAVRSMGKEISLPGRVVSMVERASVISNVGATRSSDRNQGSSGGNIYNVYYYPEVEITMPDGTTKRLQLTEGSWPPAYEVDQQVTVLYNPEQPRDATIKTSSSNIMKFLASMITGFIGLGFLGASLLVRWIWRPGPEGKSTGSMLKEGALE